MADTVSRPQSSAGCYLLTVSVNMDDFMSRWKMLNLGEKRVLEQV